MFCILCTLFQTRDTIKQHEQRNETKKNKKKKINGIKIYLWQEMIAIHKSKTAIRHLHHTFIGIHCRKTHFHSSGACKRIEICFFFLFDAPMYKTN